MASHHRQERSVRRTALRSVVAATFVAALALAGTLSFAQASSTVQPVAEGVTTPATTTAAVGPAVAELVPAPPLPVRVVPEFPLSVPEPEPEPTSTEASTDRCGDRAWWDSRDQGDPSDYVAACGTWPSWVDRGATPCLPGEQDCSGTAASGSGAAPYTGPTVGREWSPEYGYYEGRTDGPKNSDGEPCMQGRDNHDPNC